MNMPPTALINERASDLMQNPLSIMARETILTAWIMGRWPGVHYGIASQMANEALMAAVQSGSPRYIIDGKRPL